MQEEKNEIAQQILEHKKRLEHCTIMTDSIKVLQQLAPLLPQLQISQIPHLDRFLLDCLKPISREITNISLEAHAEARPQLQQAMLAIVTLYAQASFQINTFESMQELLSRFADIFRAEEPDESSKRADLEWIALSISQSQRRNQFFYRCVNQIMTSLTGIQEIFPKRNLAFVQDYFSLIYFLDEYLRRAKIEECCQKSARVLAKIVTNASEYKQFTKDLTFEAFEALGTAANKILKYTKYIELRKEIQQLGAVYGLGMLRSPTIEKKMNGLKMINKWARHFYGGLVNHATKEEDFCRWMLDNGVIDIVFEDGDSTPRVKTAMDILRLMFRKKFLGLDNLGKAFDFTERACSQNRKMVFKYMEMESIRLDYAEYNFILDRFQVLKPAEYYEEEMFLLLGEVLRYSAEEMMKRGAAIHGAILKAHMGKFRNQRVQYKCIKNLVTALIKIIDKKQDPIVKTKELLGVYDQYFSEPNKLGIMIIRNIFSELSEVSIMSKSKAAGIIVNERPIVKQSLQLLQDEKVSISLKYDLEELICDLLKQAKETVYEKVTFDEELFYEATSNPKIFKSLIQFLEYSSNYEDMFDTLVHKFNVERFSFDCLKSFFYRINLVWVSINSGQDQQQLLCLPKKLKGFDNMKYLMLNTEIEGIREEIADFIAGLYTSYTENRMHEGEKELIYTMKETRGLALKEYENFMEGHEENVCRLKGYLAFIEALMKATEVLGVGKLRAHNSLVATSTVKVKVFNEVTYGNDVLTVYEKKVPSNITLFEFIEELSQQFKCSAYEIMFREGVTMWPENLNGLTLEQVKIDGKVLTAVKSFRDRIRKQELIVNGETTPKARKAFEEIFANFAPDGKMGKKECARYVYGVTGISCEVQDSRVLDFFREYDTDGDQCITLEDFLRFYKYNSSSSREEVVWKNLFNMRYRKDLKKFNEPIEAPHEDLLFRSYLSSSPEIFTMLQELAESKIEELQRRARTLLFRLPTNPSALQSLSGELSLIQKDSFQTQYILIAIQSHLNLPEEQQRQSNIQNFISSGNNVKIFDMMVRIDQMPQPQEAEIKCLFIALQILRSLMPLPSLKDKIDDFDTTKVVLTLPKTDLFVKLAVNSLRKMDLDILESALTLEISQADSNILELALEGVFHEESEIRKITSNFIYILYKLGRVKASLFDIEVKQNSEYWFELLAKIIKTDNSFDPEEMLHKSMGKLINRSEDVEKTPEDQIIFGNLAIIHGVIDKSNMKVSKDFVEQIIELAKRVISPRNRKIIYSILATQDLTMTIQYILQLLNSVEPVKQVEPKKYYVGLKNLGSTCYMNSILQVLFIIKEFRSLVFSLNEEPSLEMTEINGQLVCDDVLLQLKKMYAYLQKSTRSYFQPHEFCLTIKDPMTGKPINPRIQEDAHEFVGSFLDQIEKYALKSDKFETFRRMVLGKTITEFTCQICSNKISREENFCQLPLEVKTFKNIEESLQKFVQPQHITDYNCEVCQMKVEKVEKSTYLSELPEIMIINLQRIIFDLETFQKVKVDSAFNFPENFNFYDYISKDIVNYKPEDCDYSLRGIVVHSGTSESGHYYSIIHDKGEWFKFNDQSVTKFDMKDIGREAYGGTESHDWNDELKFSTNAYILFYEKVKPKACTGPPTISEEVSETDNMECLSSNTDSSNYFISSELQEEIQKDNISFYKQLQVHQESIFEFSYDIMASVEPADIEEGCKMKPWDENWNESPERETYEKIYMLMNRLLDFSQIYYHISNESLFKLGTYLYRLFYLLPEKSYNFLEELTVDKCIEGLCLHNDDTIRTIFKCLLNKAMHVFSIYYQLDFASEEPGIVHLKWLLDGLFQYFNDERLFKNTYKLTHFFQFWKANCELIFPIFRYTMEKEIVVSLVDVLMANDSPFLEGKVGDKNRPKRQEIPQYQALPAIQLLCGLLRFKKDLNDSINPAELIENAVYSEMSAREKEALSNANFFRKMIRSKTDSMGLLAPITAKLCYNNLQFSKKMVEIFLKGLNSVEYELDSSLIMLNHLKSNLLINDAYSEMRLKWVFGIPQLDICDDLNYGLKYDDESTAFSYVSPLFFAQSEQYQPALHVLYMKRSVYSIFSVSGVALLLQLMNESDFCFKYVMNLPPPTYMHRSYTDWIGEYIGKLKEEDSYYMPFDKNTYYNNLSQLYHNLENKIKLHPDIKHPVCKLIVGKNKEYEMRYNYEDSLFSMALWAHKTYILDNEPTGNGNKSLPRELFKYGSPTGYAKNFMSGYKSAMEDEKEQMNADEFNIPTEWTVYTLHIDTKAELKIKFNLKHFKEEVVFLKGKCFINFPYEELEGDFINHVECEATEVKKEEYRAPPIEPANQQNLHEFPSIIEEEKGDGNYWAEKECPFCTFINFGAMSICEVCGSPLQ